MKLLNSKEEEIQKIDLGIVEAGKSKEFLFYLYNPEVADVIDIKIDINNSEITILEYPEKLSAKTKGKFRIKWSPSLALKKGLQEEVKITATELYK